MSNYTAKIVGTIQGRIWMPCAVCTKSFSISQDDFLYSDGSRPTLRDMVLRATNDGDFQSCDISEGALVIESVTGIGRNTIVTRRRYFDLRNASLFPSIQDSIVAEDDVVYADEVDY